jgi:hypothetical protein
VRNADQRGSKAAFCLPIFESGDPVETLAFGRFPSFSGLLQNHSPSVAAQPSAVEAEAEYSPMVIFIEGNF